MKKQSVARGRWLEEIPMGRAVITRVLQMIRELREDELRQVRQAVDVQIEEQSKGSGREAFHRALLSSGLVKEIKAPPLRADEERPLVPIQGKPLSETIIEERR
jgi:hypothetical protein